MRRIEAGIAGHQLRRQVEVLGLDRRVALRLAAERVEAGGEVAVGAVALEQRGGRLHRLQQLLVGLRRGPWPAAGAPSGGAEAEAGWAAASGAGVDAEVGGDRLVEAVLALQQLLDAAQEGARLGALDHPVVVGRGQRHRLRDAELAQPLRRRRVPTPAGRRSRRWRRSRSGRSSGGEPRRRCRSRPGWSARCWCPGSRRR